MMERYIFILGNNQNLSVAEIKALWPVMKEIALGDGFLVGEIAGFNCQEALARLGGTIKIGRVLGGDLSAENIVLEIGRHYNGKKINFGLSYYGVKVSRLGMEVKKLLKTAGQNCRLVVGREAALSSVIVRKNNCLDFLILPGWWGLTCAVQDFEEYGRRDFGRPASDSLSGMLPPKAAKMMINLAGADFTDQILDPFCGSGTILSEAAAMGYKNILGADISEKAVSDSQKNLLWLTEKNDIKDCFWKIIKADVADLPKEVEPDSVVAVVTEPYLGPPLRGRESPKEIEKIITDLRSVYATALGVFGKILKPGGRAVMVFPQWHIGGRIFRLDFSLEIKKQGLKKIDADDLVYKREGQKVWREIHVFEK